jgi:hypothetical protein
MHLKHGINLAYCTNIHRGETWAETFDTLQKYSLAVRDSVCPGKPYAIGLRLGDQTSRELSDSKTLLEFQRWLERENCYVFTINGFPYGRFHGGRVKEHVYEPDWTTSARVEYTNRLFDLLAQLLPPGLEGSVSTVPCSFKEFIHSEEQVATMRRNVWATVQHIAALSARTGQKLHLGLEPEPLCFLETSDEAIDFIQQVRAENGNDSRLKEHLGVNYDACHLAIEYEEPAAALRKFAQNEIKISKLHFSSALKVIPTPDALQALKEFVDVVYFHQVIERSKDAPLKRYKDLDIALAEFKSTRTELPEWRIHFHIPLHCRPTQLFETTADHLIGLMDELAKNPSLCSHIEMETYTWEVLPPEMKNRSVVDQLVAEYKWTLAGLRDRGLA